MSKPSEGAMKAMTEVVNTPNPHSEQKRAIECDALIIDRHVAPLVEALEAMIADGKRLDADNSNTANLGVCWQWAEQQLQSWKGAK